MSAFIARILRLYGRQIHPICAILLNVTTATSMDDNPERSMSLADLGDVGMRRVIPEVILPQQRLPPQDLSPEQIEFSRILGGNRLLIEDFFSRRKMSCKIIYGNFGVPKPLPKSIIRITIALANCHIKKDMFQEN
jgi:hypothetical protein